MKMENTLANKAKFFALYWGQKVIKETKLPKSPICIVCDTFITEVSDWHLELKPLSSISDEDALQVSKIINKQFPKVYSIEDGKKFIEKYIAGNILALNLSRISTLSHIEHYLRSKGYALPFMEISVEDQISYGWVKLKGETK